MKLTISICVACLLMAPIAWAQDHCIVDKDAVVAHLKTVLESHPGGTLNRSSNTITWKSSRAIATSLEYDGCDSPGTILTKHVGVKKLSEEQVLSVALAMGNTFLDDHAAETLQYAVFKNHLGYRSENGAEFYDILSNESYASFDIEYNPSSGFVRLTLSE